MICRRRLARTPLATTVCPLAAGGCLERLTLSPGEAHDVRLAEKLLSRLKSGSMRLADRGYDARAGQYPAEMQSQRADLL